MKMTSDILSVEPKLQTEKDPPENDSETTNKNTMEIYSVDSTKTDNRFDIKDLKWLNITLLAFFHIGMLYSLFAFSFLENWKTTLWIYVTLLIAGIGVTAGAHRLWTHRAYKANLPLRIILFLFYATSGLNSVYDWVRDHRVHHKYTDTDADPHNSLRGFFFSHVGWLLVKKRPEVIQRGREIDMSDILADPVVVFGSKYFSLLKVFFTFVLFVLIPVYGWNETWYRAIMSQVFIRYVLGLHIVWSVNSVAHIWGARPYNKYIRPTENKFVSFAAFGEGWHNYHHVFPWDYKTAELGNYKLNITTMFIDFCAKLGWAYDLKQPSKSLVRSVIMKKGDDTHSLWNAVPYSEDQAQI